MIAAWAALAVVFAPRAARVQRVLDVRGGSTRPTEAARASDILQQTLPSPFAEYVAVVVHGPVRWTDPRFAAVLDSLKGATERRPYVSQIVSLRSIGESTFVSADRHTTFLIVALRAVRGEDLIPDLRETIAETLRRLPQGNGFDVKVTGNPALDYDVRTISAEDTEQAEARVLPLTLVVLVVAFGALVAATLPVVIGVLAITIALGLVTIAARYQTMSVFVLNITTMVGLGVGIDYSLLIVTRFREELNRGLTPVDAAARTIETAGSAVHPVGGDRRDARGGGRGAARDDVSPRDARLPRPEHRPPPAARPAARALPRAHRVGALGPVAGTPAVACRRGGWDRHCAAHLSAHPDSPRPAGDQLVSAAI